MHDSYDDFPIEAQREIHRLNKENAKFRLQRNGFRQEVEKLRSRLGLPSLAQEVDSHIEARQASK